MMFSHDGFYITESQAKPAHIVNIAGGDSIELIKYLFLFLFADPSPVILY